MGIGGAWGSREELLHPRGKDGRFITKGKMSVAIADALTKVLDAFSPRSFQSQGQATQYLQNKAHKDRLGGGSHSETARFASDFDSVQEDLRDGVVDNPETKKYVQMMDQSMMELPDGLILTRQVSPEAFGMTAEQLGDPENGIYRLQGTLIADRGYSSTNIGNYMGTSGPGRIRMVYATPAGTRAMIPSTNPGDSEVVLDRDQTVRVSKIEPDGLGGYVMKVVAVPRDVAGPTPHPIGGHAAGSSMTPEQRKANIERSRQHFMKQAKAGVGDTAEPPPAAPQPMDESHILPTTPPVPGAAPQPGQEHPQSGQPSPVQQTPSAPGAPPARTEPTVTESAGARTPRSAPAAAPQAPSPPPPASPAPEGTPPAPEVVHPNSVPGTPDEDFVPTGTTFRDAFMQADLPSPTAGPDRTAANKAFMDLRDGKRTPREVLRDLDADIEHARNRGGAAGDDLKRNEHNTNADRLQQMRDLIAQHYKIEAAPAKKPRKAAAPKLDEEGNPVPRAVRKAAVPKLKEVEGKENPNHEPTELDAISIEGSDGTNLRRIQNRVSAGDITDAQAEKQLRDAAKYYRAHGKLAGENGHATPEVREANKAKHERIAEQYDTAADIMSGKRTARKATKKAGPAKAARPKADESGAPILRGAALDQALKDAGLSTKGLADEKRARLAEHKGGGGESKPEVKAPSVPAKKAAPAEAAPTKAEIAKAEASNTENLAAAKAVKKTAKKAPALEDRPVQRTPDEQARVDNAVLRRAASLPDEPRNSEEKRIKDRAAAIRKERGVPPPPGAKAKGAGVPSPTDRTSVGAAAGKIRASDLQEGDRILVDPTTGAATTRKTGAKTVTITSNKGATGRRRIVTAVDDDGNEVQVRGQGLRSGPDAHPASIQTFLLEKASPAKKAATREAAETKAAPKAPEPELHPSVKTPEVRKALTLDGNPRAEKPFDDPDRAKAFAQAWKSAGIPVEKGSAGTTIKETIEGIYLGNTSPQQGLRQMESDISFNRDDLGDVQRLLRTPPADATPQELSALRKKEAKLKRDIATQEKVSKFLHGHFQEETPTVAEVKKQLPKSVSQHLDSAPLEQIRQQAEAGGLGKLQGDTREELLQDAVAKATKQVRKAAPTPAIEVPAAAPGKPSHVDLTHGLDLSDATKAELQKELNGTSTTRTIAKRIRTQGDGVGGPGTRAAMMQVTPDDKRDAAWHAEHDKLRKQSEDVEQLATRLESTTRARLSAPKPEPKTLTPAQEKQAAKVAEIAGVPEARVQARMVEAKEAAAPAAAHHQATADMLKAAKTREEAEAILAERGKTVADLKGIAKASGIVLTPGARKERIHGQIVDSAIGSELDRAAINPRGDLEIGGMEASRPTAPQIPDTPLAPAVVRPRAARASGPVEKLTPAQASQRLKAAATREEADELLAGRTAGELRAIAKESGVPLKSGDRRDKIQELLVQSEVGFRLDRGAIGQMMEGHMDVGRSVEQRQAAIEAARGAGAPAVKLIPHSDNVNHGDSALGQLWEGLPKATDEDRTTANAVEELASTMSLPRNHSNVEAPQQALEGLRKLRAKAPPSSHAAIDAAISKLDAPPAKKVDLPEGTPPVLRGIVDDLQKIPAARKSGRVGGRTRDKSTVQEMVDLIKETSEGKGDPRTLDTRMHDILRGHHESVEGSQQMWAMEPRLRDAFKEVRDWRRASFQSPGAPSAPSTPKAASNAASDLLDRIGSLKIDEIRAEAGKLGIDTEGMNKNALIHAIEAKAEGGK